MSIRWSRPPSGRRPRARRRACLEQGPPIGAASIRARRFRRSPFGAGSVARASRRRSDVVPDPRRLFGDDGERIAADALAARGMRIVARNARTRFGELDLVARDRRGYVFIEVKTRRAGSFVAAAEAVDARKLARVRRLALGWLAEQGLPGGSPRIVVAAVTVGARTTVELIEVD